MESGDTKGDEVSEPQSPLTATTVAVSVHGPAGVLDLVVPDGATSVDVAREYAARAGLSSVPLLQTSVGRLVTADRDLHDAGVESGDLLVASAGVTREQRGRDLRDRRRQEPETPGPAALGAALGAAVAALAAWYAGHADLERVRTVVVGLLLLCALASTLPGGRHRAQRAAAAPAYGAAAAFAALWVPGDQLLPPVVAVCGLTAAAVAAVARALASREAQPRTEAMTAWIATGVVLFVVCGAVPVLEWDSRVAWALLVLLAMFGARLAPSLAVDVPDDALLDLDRLAITAWSARDRAPGRRGRMVVPRTAMEALVAHATGLVTAGTAAVLGVTLLAAPLLVRDATVDLDRIGALCLLLFAGASLVLAARSYRHRAARTMLRCAGLVDLGALVVALAGPLAAGWGAWVFAGSVVLGVGTVVAAVATGRGWRSVRWSRRAEVAEALCGAFAVAAAVAATGLFRALWEITS